MTQGLQVLIVDDEIQIRRFLKLSLEANGYLVFEAESGREALSRFGQIHPDLVILDLGLPDMEGLDVLKTLRQQTETPIIILSVRDSDADKVQALDAGADDYLTKPFSTSELMARMRVANRHHLPVAEMEVFSLGHLEVNLSQRLVKVQGEPIKLTPTEYALLRLFIQHAGKVLTQHQILREIWGLAYLNETHYLRVYIAHLRQKIEENPALPRLLLTESGVGYRLVDRL
jgi:two-component system, OmpR family, KDP operon response regulator KdpE